MSMISLKSPKLLLGLVPFARMFASPFKAGPGKRHEYRVNLEDLPTHMLRDIGIVDGHATPSRHVGRDDRERFS